MEIFYVVTTGKTISQHFWKFSKKNKGKAIAVLVAMALIISCGAMLGGCRKVSKEERTLRVYVGGTMQPVIKKLAEEFEKKTIRCCPSFRKPTGNAAVGDASHISTTSTPCCS